MIQKIKEKFHMKKKKFAEVNDFIFQEVSPKYEKIFEALFKIQIFKAIYNKFKSECDQREKIGYNDEKNGNYEVNEYSNKKILKIKIK